MQSLIKCEFLMWFKQTMRVKDGHRNPLKLHKRMTNFSWLKLLKIATYLIYYNVLKSEVKKISYSMLRTNTIIMYFILILIYYRKSTIKLNIFMFHKKEKANFLGTCNVMIR